MNHIISFPLVLTLAQKYKSRHSPVSTTIVFYPSSPHHQPHTSPSFQATSTCSLSSPSSPWPSSHLRLLLSRRGSRMVGLAMLSSQLVIIPTSLAIVTSLGRNITFAVSPPSTQVITYPSLVEANQNTFQNDRQCSRGLQRPDQLHPEPKHRQLLLQVVRVGPLSHAHSHEWYLQWCRHPNCQGRSYANQNDAKLQDGDGYFDDRISSIRCEQTVCITSYRPTMESTELTNLYR